MAPGLARTNATTSSSDPFATGGCMWPAKTTRVQYALRREGVLPWISEQNFSRAGERSGGSTGSTDFPPGQLVTFFRNSSDTCERLSEATAFELLTMTL